MAGTFAYKMLVDLLCINYVCNLGLVNRVPAIYGCDLDFHTENFRLNFDISVFPEDGRQIINKYFDSFESLVNTAHKRSL